MSYLEQSDLTSDEMRAVLGNNVPRGGKTMRPNGRRGVEVVDDGNSRSIVTIFEQARERLDEVSSSFDLVRENI